ncbi:pickpocket protein 28-like isoform X2 [Nilaparvata lugens]|nr:pickpocket protein 28-like isoform X2 [Nilaparvata lugens]
MFAILFSFLLSLYLINGLWIQWNESPVIVSFEEKLTPIWDVPFPAVTICSKNKVRRTVFNYTAVTEKNSSELTVYEKKKLFDAQLLCQRTNSSNKAYGSETLNESSIAFLEEIAEKFFFDCFWRKDKLHHQCRDVFDPIMTNEGYCITINSLNHSDIYHQDGLNSKYLKSFPNSTDWNLEGGYKSQPPSITHPRRSVRPGIKFGLEISLTAKNEDFDSECSGDSQGFMVILHNPAEIATASNQFYNLPPNQELFLAVKPNMMTTSSNLLSYSPEHRQCYFAHERKLAFFKVYTQKNCELECQTNYTLNLCGCVYFYMPRAKDTPICGAGFDQMICGIFYAYSDEFPDLIEEFKSISELRIGPNCNCLQSCTSLEYEAETSQGALSIKGGMADRSYSKVTIYFKDPQFIATHRSALYGLYDFLGKCGGLLGLTNGFCILSLVEIIYYLTLRLYSNYFQEKKPEEIEMGNLSECDSVEKN